MTISTTQINTLQQSATQVHPIAAGSLIGWRQPRRVAYIHRHAQLQDHCLYFWNHQENTPEPAEAQEFSFLLEDIFCEKRGEFKADKLIIDINLGIDGQLRLISGLNTTCAMSILACFCALAPQLLIGPMRLRLRPGNSHGVVLPTLYVDNEWVDGRPFSRDEDGEQVAPQLLLTEVQTLLKHGLNVELLPHQHRIARSQVA